MYHRIRHGNKIYFRTEQSKANLTEQTLISSCCYRLSLSLSLGKGAMENWGLVTYRETALMIDEAKASPQQKQRVAIVVAHELAHQWFGKFS